MLLAAHWNEMRYARRDHIIGLAPSGLHCDWPFLSYCSQVGHRSVIYFHYPLLRGLNESIREMKAYVNRNGSAGPAWGP